MWLKCSILAWGMFGTLSKDRLVLSIIKDQVLGDAPHFEKHNSSHILSPIHLFDSNIPIKQWHMQVKLVFMCACILVLVGDACGSLYCSSASNCSLKPRQTPWWRYQLGNTSGIVVSNKVRSDVPTLLLCSHNACCQNIFKKHVWTRWRQLWLSKLLLGSWRYFFDAAAGRDLSLFACSCLRNWSHPKQCIMRPFATARTASALQSQSQAAADISHISFGLCPNMFPPPSLPPSDGSTWIQETLD